MASVQSPDMEYGYSYEQHKDSPSNGKTIEHFNQNDNKYNFHIIAYVLILLVFILACIRLYYNSHKNVK